MTSVEFNKELQALWEQASIKFETLVNIALYPPNVRVDSLNMLYSAYMSHLLNLESKSCTKINDNKLDYITDKIGRKYDECLKRIDFNARKAGAQ